MPLKRLRVELDKMGKYKSAQQIANTRCPETGCENSNQALKRLENFWQRKENRGHAIDKKISV